MIPHAPHRHFNNSSSCPAAPLSCVCLSKGWAVPCSCLLLHRHCFPSFAGWQLSHSSALLLSLQLGFQRKKWSSKSGRGSNSTFACLLQYTGPEQLAVFQSPQLDWLVGGRKSNVFFSPLLQEVSKVRLVTAMFAVKGEVVLVCFCIFLIGCMHFPLQFNGSAFLSSPYSISK